MTFDLSVGIAKLSLLITLSRHIYIRHWNFELNCLNRRQICPLSETRKGDSFSNNVSLTGLAEKALYSRLRPQNVCSKRYFQSPRRPPLNCAKNASPRARLSTRKVFASYDWLSPNPLGTPRYVSRSKNNLRGITCGIRLVCGMASLP